MAQYDVFVSYNSKDGKWAEVLAKELKDVGVRVWFDQWELEAGGTWLNALETAMTESASVAVLVGPSGLGAWEEAELRQAITKLVKEGCRVIPIILPDVVDPQLPPYLQQCQYIDYRDGQSPISRMERLVLGITGRKLTHTISQVGKVFQLDVPQTGQCLLVHTLPHANPNRHLYLSWETFGQGVEHLRDQIVNQQHHLLADACIAINDAGLAIASFLSGSIMHRRKIGYIKTEGTPQGGGRRIIGADSWLPKKLPPTPVILLVDSEIKTGSDLKVIVEKLRSEYKDPLIHYAVLAAMVKEWDPKISHFDELMSSETLQALNLKAVFIAYTMTRKGIEPPLEVR